MPTTLGVHTYRLAFPFGQDRETFGIRAPSGTSIKFQIGVYEDSISGDFWDMSNVATTRCEVRKMKHTQCRPSPVDPTYIQSGPIAPDVATVAAAGWADGSEQHVTFAFSPSDTAVDTGEYWLSFSGILTGGEYVSFGWGRINFVQDGTGITSPVQPLDSSYYTAAQIDDWHRATGLTPTHSYYANHYSSIPTSVPFSGNGTVLAYPLLGTTRYRLIPDPYNPVEDAFYESFSDPTPSGLIVRLSLD